MTAKFSFLSVAESVTVAVWQGANTVAPAAAELAGRVTAVALLSLAAACDLAYHGLMTVPTALYGLVTRDCTICWQHLQRVQNVVFALLFASVAGLIHPLFGVAMCEPTDKHAVIGMLASNTLHNQNTVCSPIDSLSLVERLARSHQFTDKKEIFSQEQLQLIRDVKEYEKSLELLQAQEFIHKITNVTLYVMASIVIGIHNSSLSESTKEIAIRAAGVLVPVLSCVDLAITLLVEGFFALCCAVRLVTGRGPVYTEVTRNPLMHASFLIQSLLKTVGNLVGTFVWFVKPQMGVYVSLLAPNLFFKLQLDWIMLRLASRLKKMSENSFFALPIVYGNGEASALAVPTHSMHKTYLIVEKEKDDRLNLYWINRPNITHKKGLDSKAAGNLIKEMLLDRYPFMDIQKVMNYPVTCDTPTLPDASTFTKIVCQGNITNCVVSNLFGMLEAFDKIKGVDKEVTKLRYKVVRQALQKDYSFYAYDYNPLGENVSDLLKDAPSSSPI